MAAALAAGSAISSREARFFREIPCFPRGRLASAKGAEAVLQIRHGGLIENEAEVGREGESDSFDAVYGRQGEGHGLEAHATFLESAGLKSWQGKGVHSFAHHSPIQTSGCGFSRGFSDLSSICAHPPGAMDGFAETPQCAETVVSRSRRSCAGTYFPVLETAFFFSGRTPDSLFPGTAFSFTFLRSSCAAFAHS